MVLRPGHALDGDWLLLGLEACALFAVALVLIGGACLIVGFFSKWAGRLIDSGPLGMWRH